MKRSARAEYSIRNGHVLIAGDMHYWPNLPISTAHRAFCVVAQELKPELVVLNGDVIDGASISDHKRIGWEYQPTVAEEIEVAHDRLDEIKRSMGRARGVWNLGNHDGRFETRLAKVAPEFAEVHGIHLKDHFPEWHPAWSVWINKNTMVKHRWKGGVHAAFNNAKDSGQNIVTNHLHALNMVGYTDYSGTRWGVDAGCIADPRGPQFSNYTEDNPLNWRSGFVVLRYENGILQMPDLLYVQDEDQGLVNFRGESWTV